MSHAKGKTFLVTGGAGFLGAALVKRLVADGARVRVLDDQTRGSQSRLRDVQRQIEFIGADVRDAQAVRNAAQDVDAVWHLAYVNGTGSFYEKPELVLDVAVKGMANVLDACRAGGVRELLLVSSSEVYQTPAVVPTDETAPLSIPDPLNPRYSYGGGKIISELMAINYGRNGFDRVVILRPHNVYGPDMGYEHVIPQFILRMRALRDHKVDPVPFPIQGTGQETRAFVFIDDCIDGFLAAQERGAHLGIYHVGTTEEVTIESVAQLISGHFGRQIRLVAGAPALGGTPRRCPDIRKLAALGYQPRVALRDGVAMTVKWYDEQASGREPALEPTGAR